MLWMGAWHLWGTKLKQQCWHCISLGNHGSFPQDAPSRRMNTVWVYSVWVTQESLSTLVTIKLQEKKS